MAKPDFRAAATARLNEERSQSLSQNVLSLLSADKTTIIRPTAVRNIPVDRIDPNPNQPRMAMDKAGLDDLTASVREHGVLRRPGSGLGESERYPRRKQHHRSADPANRSSVRQISLLLPDPRPGSPDGFHVDHVAEGDIANRY